MLEFDDYPGGDVGFSNVDLSEKGAWSVFFYKSSGHSIVPLPDLAHMGYIADFSRLGQKPAAESLEFGGP